MPDIFLSYNREDPARATLFAEAFEKQGFSVWWDVDLQAAAASRQLCSHLIATLQHNKRGRT